MSGIFFGINIGVTALRAQQTAISVTGHNIANANTPGYSRQVANMHTNFALPVPSNNRWTGAGQIGTGVSVSEVKRVRDQFIDWQIRAESGVLEEWKARHDTLTQIETVFMEPMDTGLSELLNDFWNSWQDLSKTPDSSPVRTTVKETAIALAEAFRHSYERLENIETGLDENMEILKNEANSLLGQISVLNEQIKYITTGGDNPNDLLDQRDLLLDRLAELMDIEVTYVKAPVAGKEVATGEIKVALLSEPEYYLIDPTDSDIESGHRVLSKNGLEIYVPNPDDDNPKVLDFKTGEMYGLQKTGADSNTDASAVSYYKNKLDVMAKGLADILNEVHSSGITLKQDENDKYIMGEDFFVFKDEKGNVVHQNTNESDDDFGKLYYLDKDDNEIIYYTNDINYFSAKYMHLNPDIESDVGYIAAGGGEIDDFNPGNNKNALEIAALRNMRLTVDDGELVETEGTGDLTFDTYYQNFVAELGVATKEADRMVDNQTTLVNQLTNRREAVAGVSLDEEMANMIKYQHAFQAASKYISVLDELAATIVNGLKA